MKSRTLGLLVTVLSLLSPVSAAVLPASSNIILIPSTSATATTSSGSSHTFSNTADVSGYTSVDPDILVKTVTKSDEKIQM